MDDVKNDELNPTSDFTVQIDHFTGNCFCVLSFFTLDNRDCPANHTFLWPLFSSNKDNLWMEGSLQYVAAFENFFYIVKWKGLFLEFVFAVLVHISTDTKNMPRWDGSLLVNTTFYSFLSLQNFLVIVICCYTCVFSLWSFLSVLKVCLMFNVFSKVWCVT